ARDGFEAVDLAASERPDLAVLDVKMPRLDGIEAARRILDERPIPVVMLTAYGQEELVARAIEAGVFGYLVKPFRETDLLPAGGGRDGARAPGGPPGGAGGGGAAGGGPGAAKGDRARQGPVDEEGDPDRGRGVRPPAQGQPGLGPAAARHRRGRRRDSRRRVSEHPNAALTRRIFGAFGRDAKVISAGLARDIVWRVPRNTVMSGEANGPPPR